MKKLIILTTLILVGCTDSNKDYESIVQLQRNTQENLMECKNQLDFYRASSAIQAADEPAEPSCEKANYDEIYVDGRLLATCLSDDVKIEACGINAQNCEGGFSHLCLQNVKLRTVEKEVCN